MTTGTSTVATFRLSPQQTMLWRHGLAFEPVTLRLRLSTAPDTDRLEAALHAVVSRHEILRTRIVDTAEGPVQDVGDAPTGGDLLGGQVSASRPFVANLSDDDDGAVLAFSVAAAMGDIESLVAVATQVSALCLDPTGDVGEVIQYADLAEGYHELLHDDAASRYWRERLPSHASVLPRSATETREDTLHRATLQTPPTWSDAKLFARWLMFQSRLTRRSRLGTRYIAAGVRHVEGVDLMGAVARPLALSFQLDWRISVAAIEAVLTDTIAADLAMADHHDCLSPAHDDADRFTFEPRVGVPTHFAGIPVIGSDIQVPAQPCLFRMRVTGHDTVEVIAHGQDDPTFALAMNLLRALLTDDAALGSMRLHELAPSDRARPAADHARYPDLLADIAAWVVRAPTRIAVSDADGALTFAQLWSDACAASAALVEAGVAPAARVVLRLPRGREWLLWWMATWMADAVVIPLSCQAPVAHALERCRTLGVRHAVAGSDMDDASICRLSPDARGKGTDIRRSEVDGTRHAYVLSTSGSTGLPKATVVDHAALRTYLSWARHRYGLDDGHGALVASDATFDFTQTSLWLPLLAGETVHLAAPDMRVHDVPAATRRLPRLAFIKLTPTHLQVLAEMEAAGEPGPVWPSHVIVGGEALSGAMLPLSLRRSGTILHNEYGPTEATVGCCVHSIPVDAVPDGPVPIGHAAPGMRQQVLDARMAPVDGTRTGELYLAGDQLACGYDRDPRRTAAAFVPHPTPAYPGERCYRTGDLLVRDAEDGWRFLGRNDDVVKRHGVRIELHALSSQLLRHAAVTGCHTFARTTGHGTQPSIVCAVTGEGLDTDTLREWLAARVPTVEMPNRIVVLDRLPCTPHGKIDADALERAIDAPAAMDTPMTADEATLAVIWRRVLGLERVLPGSHFFVEGGDSIRAISVAVEARRAGLNLAADDLFRRPVLRDLAAGLTPAPAATTTAATEATTLGQGPEEDRFPASHLQMGMIFQNQSHAGDGRYHDIFSYRLQVETFDEACLREASRRIVRRHPALRSTFDLHGEEPTQVVWAVAPEVLQVVDLQGLDPNEQEAIVRAWITTERTHGFDITILPLLRFVVHRLDPRSIRFTVSFHHAIMDGWSDQQIHTELFDDYRRLLRGEATHVAVFDSGLRAFVEAERAALDTPAVVDYWRDYLDGATSAPVGDIDTAAVDGPAPPTPPIEHYLEVPASQAEAIASASRDTGEPIPVLLLAAHLLAVRIMTGQTDVVSAYVANCRLDGDGMERSVGLFINTLPLRVRVDTGDWIDLAKRVGTIQREAFIHRRLPYARISRMAGEAATPSSLFYFTHFHNGIERTTELVQLGRDAHEVTSFPLTASFNLCPQTGRLVYTLAFARTHFSASRAAQFVAVYEAALAGLAYGMHRALPRATDVPGLRSSSLDGGETVVRHTWLDGLARHLHERPHAIAATCRDERLSYARLDEVASCIAAGLVERSIRPGDAVATFLPRGIDLVTALVGVARAAAVLVAVDANEPPARRDHILHGVRLVVTDAAAHDLPANIATVSLAALRHDARPSSVPAPAGPRAEWPAYRMHTSGSTGAPKCVEVSHASYAAVLQHFQDTLHPGPDDRIMQTTATSFDICMLEYGLALTSGATLVVLDPEAAVSPAAYTPETDFGGRTIVQATPSLWSVLRLRGFDGVPRMTALAGGEALPPDLHAWLNERADQLWNVYGPTETTIWSTAARMDGTAVSIGQPIAGTQVHLLDITGAPVPQGSMGMIHIGGLGVAIGYVGQPRATAMAFLPDPFAEVPGSRMYRTGDLACLDDRGCLVFRGRADTQVKISGHRLELSEIEARLRAHPEIEDAVVVPPQQPDDGLGAHLLMADGCSLPSSQALRTWLASHLPPYAIPRRYGVLDAVPRTVNGKLDRRRIASLALTGADVVVDEPRDALETVVLKLWSKVLRSDGIGVTTDFLAIGGYSLTAIRIVAQLRDLFGIDVPATTLFTASTVRDLADHLRQIYPDAQVDRKAAILAKMLA